MNTVLTLSASTDIIEGGILGAFEISLDSPAPAGGIVVLFTTTGSTATPNVDYTLIAGIGVTSVTSNTFTIAAGVSRATINVSALNDAIIEPDETIILNLLPGTSYISNPVFNRTSFTVADGTYNVVAKDFNSDGKLDFLTFNNNNIISVLLGSGNGTFIADSNLSVGYNPNLIEVGDFNNDGKLDLAMASGSNNYISILLSNGNGTFGNISNFATLGSVGDLTIGDLNGDSKLDLVTSSSVLIGIGNGTFSTASSAGIDLRNYANGSINRVELGDLNGDSKLDLIKTVGAYSGSSSGTMYCTSRVDIYRQ
jgi:FG-GAP-like repeat